MPNTWTCDDNELKKWRWKVSVKCSGVQSSSWWHCSSCPVILWLFHFFQTVVPVSPVVLPGVPFNTIQIRPSSTPSHPHQTLLKCSFSVKSSLLLFCDFFTPLWTTYFLEQRIPFSHSFSTWDWWLTDFSIFWGSLHMGDTPENLSDYLTAYVHSVDRLTRANWTNDTRLRAMIICMNSLG